MMKSIPALTLAALLGVLATPLSFADDSHHASASGSATASAAMSEGEVKKIDKDAGKITIKHGPLANLEMPPMTMMFRVKDQAMLDQVKAGDKIRFVAEKANGALVVTRLEQAR